MRPRPLLPHASVVFLLLLAAPTVTRSEEPLGNQLGQAPRLTDARQLVAERYAAPSPQAVIDTSSRQAVIDAYRAVYLAALAVPNDWNGNAASCIAGTTSAAYTDATLQMVNYFRAMAGLGTPLPHNATKDAKAQQAALMMEANHNLSHSPPPSWKCYTPDGAEAAGVSDLAGGIAGAAAVAAYVQDAGSVGHRRWILLPIQTEMGTGSTSSYTALWVIGDFGARPASPTIVAWPGPGFVPYTLAYPVWSFSVNSDSVVDFSSATVSMTQGGLPVSLSVLPVETGYGDPTITWEPSGIIKEPGMADQTFSVTVANVRVGGIPAQYTYNVTVIDPNPPTAGAISPNGGSTAGGTSVTITGTNFTAPATVSLGGAPATEVNVVSPTTITAVTPAHASGIGDVVVSVAGSPAATLAGGYFYFTPGPPTRFYTLTPCRLVDTRRSSGDGLGGPPLAASSRRSFTLTGVCGIPLTARALSVNMTVTGATSAGFMTIFPGDGIQSSTSNCNFSAGQTRANSANVLLSTNGTGVLAALNGSAGQVHLILDVNGYFE
jgi:uncharacterized protein YkwD